MTDRYQTLEIERLRERIDTLEGESLGPMAAVRHMRRGLDGRYLTDVLRAELTGEDAVRMAYEVELVCPQNGRTHLPREIREVMAFYPDHIPDPPLGPWLLVAFADSVLAGTHVLPPRQRVAGADRVSV